jgi:uncharacterized protein YjiS (DUF1127 family)
MKLRVINRTGTVMNISWDALATGARGTEASALKIRFGYALMPFSVVSRVMSDWRRRRADTSALRMMTDRELRDIGLSRTDAVAIAENIYPFGIICRFE